MRTINGSLEVTKNFLSKRNDAKLQSVSSGVVLTSESESILRTILSVNANVDLPTSGLFAGWGTLIINDDSSSGNAIVRVSGSTLATVRPGDSVIVFSLTTTPSSVANWTVATFGTSIQVTNGLFYDGVNLGVRLLGIAADGSGSLSNNRTLDFSSGSLETRLATDSGLEKYSHASDGGLRIARVYTAPHDASSSWTGPVGDYYSISVLAATHGQGSLPDVRCYETVGGNVEEVLPDSISIGSTGNVTVSVLSSPDLRYAGKIVIQQAR